MASLHCSLMASQSASTGSYLSSSSVAIRLPSRRANIGSLRLLRRTPSLTCSVSTGAEHSVKPAITLSEKALKHLTRMRKDLNEDLCLRLGVRQGGCSGMSYTMDFEQRANVRSDDSIIDYDGFTMVCDPKSLLYLYGMQLDYSDALIGGGFSFSNPNATSTCGCGKSFAA